jgi:2-(1,2-epoxy-1,2-dihydrophenyl)acetyl-CoA isomerase
MLKERFGDVTVALDDSFVATVEMHRPPENFFSLEVIDALGDAYDMLDAEPDCRAILLCAQGKHFCAGADLSGRSAGSANGAAQGPDLLYRKAARLFDNRTPVVAAVQGAAIGAGFGLACSADFRIGCPEARFSANFAQFGFHHIFGLSITLPAIVGQQHALDLLFTGRRVKGEEAMAMGLCDKLVTQDVVRQEAYVMAAEIAASAPLAIRSIRQTMRTGLIERIRAATEHEAVEQEWLQSTADWTEGVRAAREGRPPRFEGR